MNNRDTKSSATAAQRAGLRQTVMACLSAAHRREPAGNLSGVVIGSVAITSQKDRETNLEGQQGGSKRRKRQTRETRQAQECLSKIIAAAEADATSVGNHLDHLVEHLLAIGCTDRADVQEYFDLANRVLASLYQEAAKAHPSPSELTKLALRYALDARHPVEGEVGRFAFRRQQDAWEVIEYPSMAMRVPAIPLPGRPVKNVFAVRILDYLQRQPPAIYALMGLIEDLLGGVPAETDGLSGNANNPGRAEQLNIEVDLQTSIVWLNGEPIPVTNEQAHFVHLVASAGGSWISSKEIRVSGSSGTMIGARPDRVRKKLPSSVRGLIESSGGRGFPCGQNTPLSIKTFGDGSLNAAECRDFGRGSDAEQLVVAGQSPVTQRVAGARAKIGRPAAMVELLSGVRGQAALR